MIGQAPDSASDAAASACVVVAPMRISPSMRSMPLARRFG